MTQGIDRSRDVAGVIVLDLGAVTKRIGNCRLAIVGVVGGMVGIPQRVACLRGVADCVILRVAGVPERIGHGGLAVIVVEGVTRGVAPGIDGPGDVTVWVVLGLRGV